MIRGYFPGVIIRVRLDGGFAHPAVLDFLDSQPKLEYVVAMAKNAVLKRIAAPGVRQARQLSRRSGHGHGKVVICDLGTKKDIAGKPEMVR